MNIKYSKILGLSLLFFVTLEGLDAFSIRNIPIYWIGVSFFLLVFLILYFFGFRIPNFNLLNKNYNASEKTFIEEDNFFDIFICL